MNSKTKRITVIGMLCAITYVTMVVGRIPIILFLKYDPSDVIVTLGGFIWGPMTSCIVSVIVATLEMITVSDALDIGRKIKAQARQAMKDGDYIGARAPYGYRKDPDNCHKLLIDENTAPVVKQIFEWAHEHVALNRIVRNLNEMGIPAPSHYKKTTGEITSPGLIGSGKWQTRTVMKVGNANMLTKALIDRLINKVYVFPGDRIEIEYATQDFLETKESEKEV